MNARRMQTGIRCTANTGDGKTLRQGTDLWSTPLPVTMTTAVQSEAK
jgi:hypothetical protein